MAQITKGQRRLIHRLAVLLIFAMSAPSVAALELSQFKVTQPGQLMIHQDQRRAGFLQIEPGERYALCTAPETGWPRHGPQKNITRYEQPGQNLALTLMRASAVHLAAEHQNFRKAARRAVIHNLRYWAKHRGFSQYKGEIHANHFYNLDRTLLPVIVSYGLIRDDPDVRQQDRDAIEAWLHDIVMQRGPLREVDVRRVSARNNHSYLRASVSMAWGALEGNDELFQTGISTFSRALDQFNDDASLPLELERGAYALSYHRHSLASLIAIAEMAFVQGHDLYEMSNERGQTIHDLVDYLANGLENPDGQDLFFMNKRGHDRHYMAWFEAYYARFPDREASKIIREKMNRRNLFAEPLLDDYSGGVTSCLFRSLARNASQTSNN